VPPIFSVVGAKNAGKTTLIERVVPALMRRGLRVGALKHHHVGDFEADTPGKDSWRHAQAGAVLTGVVAPSKLAVFVQTEVPVNPADVVAMFQERVDVVLAEGFFQAGFPKVEVVRQATGREPRATKTDGLVALVTDGVWDRGVPVFGLDDIEALADFLAARGR
jgi:molybdopterin-guanine dinucleotide biosynthesis protein B